MKDIERFQEWVNSEVEPEILKSIDNGNSHFIPINEVESRLDPLSWSTRNFQYTIFKDGYSNLCVAASLELEIKYFELTGSAIIRTFVGSCNFSLKAIEPNTHFLATAKSECIKNAASDIGKYFGRGLNDGVIPFNKPIEKKVVKSNPDAKIMQQFANAVMNGDEATITLLSNMYDIKIENNVEESKN
jgi:hypothetical protein